MKYIFSLKRNIHMYNHLLICTYGDNKYEAICESAPTEEETILFWPDDLGLPRKDNEEMMKEFINWLETQNFKYIIYKGKRC